MKILKFGGSSVANAKNITKVIQIISKSLNETSGLIIVVSALGGVTDNLMKMASLASSRNDEYRKTLGLLVSQHNEAIEKLIDSNQRKSVLSAAEMKYAELNELLQGIYLLGELSPRALDRIMSFGEQLSAYIICEAMRAKKYDCQFVDSRTLIKTDDNFGSAHVNIRKTYELLAAYFQPHQKLSIMGGFIASNANEITTTLGRGGSDYTASLVGAAINADVIEIWTDVDGVMTADPSKVKDAFPLAQISYEEAGELAHFGAKVIHPKTMKPARLKNIPIVIKNTFNPPAAGTRIDKGKSDQNVLIKGISSLGNIALLCVQSSNGKSIGDIAAKIFDMLSRREIEVLLITQASHEHAISVAVNKNQAVKAKHAIESAFALELKAKEMLPVSVGENLSIVAIVGKRMKGVPGISGKLFNTLGVNDVNIVAIAQGSSELNVSTVISSDDEAKALQAIHRTFFGAEKAFINLFLIGTGLVGSTLLKQIEASQAPIRLCGLANSKSAYFDTNGIPLRLRNKKQAEGVPVSVDEFAKQMIQFNLPNSVLVDCTASEAPVAVYESILKAGISIVTPNKKANSGSLKRYRKLHELAKENKAHFLYETNVGAGLPIIHTLQNLVRGGDEVIKIEGVLSGTLSYIFNAFSSGNKRFSKIVREAKQKGFTEPDPRDDLNGKDVARKILILAREIGLALEPKQVKVEPLLPATCFSAQSVADFFFTLEKLDEDFENRKKQIARQNKVLRYIAVLENGKASVKLQAISSNHPFYHLSGSDNIISISTKRYNDTPLVIKGPGAGAEVTAGGVFADILSIFNGLSYEKFK